jgi:integrase
MIQHHHAAVCRAAGIRDFWFRDFRHCCATRWAKEKNLSRELWSAAMGWSVNSGQQNIYVNLQPGDVAKGFGLK